jgi:hypothetical protein
VKQGSIHLQLITGLKTAARVATSPRFALAVVFVPLLLYLFREITHDALIIDPFIVPARFTDAGLTGQVIAQRVGDHLRHIEVLSRTRMPTDHPLGSQDETVIPDIEIPGTNLGLKTLVAVVRGIFSVYTNTRDTFRNSGNTSRLEPTARRSSSRRTRGRLTMIAIHGRTSFCATTFTLWDSGLVTPKWSCGGC